MARLSHYELLVGIETDATRYHGTNPLVPRPLDKTAAEQLAAHLSADLTQMLPGISQGAMTLSAALYDQTQLLRPEFPLFAVLAELLEASYVGKQFQPRLLSFGAVNGRMPDIKLQPDPTIPPSCLQLVPVLLSGDQKTIEELSLAMEHQFIEQGQVSANTALWLEQAFDIGIIHARFMTLFDLGAMLQLQLESFGFEPLWQILECALFNPGGILKVDCEFGNRFELRNDTVYSPFYSFDQWAGGPGRSFDAARHQLGQAYADWTRTQRQYLATLRAHGMQTKQHLPGEEREVIDAPFLREIKPATKKDAAISITEHEAGELGTVAITTTGHDQLVNYYPLEPEGLNEIHKLLRERPGSEASVSFPGFIYYDEQTRCLIPDNR